MTDVSFFLIQYFMFNQMGPDVSPEPRETQNESLKKELEVLKPELQLIKSEVPGHICVCEVFTSQIKGPVD